MVIASDPAVEASGVDAGFSPRPDTLRAPDVAVLPKDAPPGWIHGVPPLAIEYADRGQEEEKLAEKIADLLEFGTEVIWVVRLGAIPYVEVHRPQLPVQRVQGGEELTAPGILENPIPAEALWNPIAAQQVTFRNLLNRFGYRDLDEVRLEGREEGREEGRDALRAAIRAAWAGGGRAPDAVTSTELDALTDRAGLTAELQKAITKLSSR